MVVGAINSVRRAPGDDGAGGRSGPGDGVNKRRDADRTEVRVAVRRPPPRRGARRGGIWTRLHASAWTSSDNSIRCVVQSMHYTIISVLYLKNVCGSEKSKHGGQSGTHVLQMGETKCSL